jgi:cyclophilin family peptidyl-prolyl cis-trans isomerase
VGYGIATSPSPDTTTAATGDQGKDRYTIGTIPVLFGRSVMRPHHPSALGAEAPPPSAAGQIDYSGLVFVHRSRSFRVLLLCGAGLWMAACSGSSADREDVPAGAKSSGGRQAVIETDKGAIEIEFFVADSPMAVENFRLLAERGYYDGVTFHRIVKGFMIQGGDPSGDGTGGESAWGGTFADEIDPGSQLYQTGYRRGIVAMANAGPNTNGSQFFIMHADYPLPPNYVIFARVISGLEVVDALADTPTTSGPGGEPSKPLTSPVIKTVTTRP